MPPRQGFRRIEDKPIEELRKISGRFRNISLEELEKSQRAGYIFWRIEAPEQKWGMKAGEGMTFHYA